MACPGWGPACPPSGVLAWALAGSSRPPSSPSSTWNQLRGPMILPSKTSCGQRQRCGLPQTRFLSAGSALLHFIDSPVSGGREHEAQPPLPPLLQMWATSSPTPNLPPDPTSCSFPSPSPAGPAGTGDPAGPREASTLPGQGSLHPEGPSHALPAHTQAPSGPADANMNERQTHYGLLLRPEGFPSKRHSPDLSKFIFN